MTPCRFTQMRSAPSRLDDGLRRRTRRLLHLAGYPPETACTIHVRQTPWFPDGPWSCEVRAAPADDDPSPWKRRLKRLVEYWLRLRTRWPS